MKIGLIQGHFTLTSCSYSISRWVTDIRGGGQEKRNWIRKGKSDDPVTALSMISSIWSGFCLFLTSVSFPALFSTSLSDKLLI